MVMEGKRVLTVEEARALPPLTERELEERRASMARLMAEAEKLRQQILHRRGGVPIPDEDIDWALSHDDDDDSEQCE